MRLGDHAWSKMHEQRDQDGLLTPLALALDALAHGDGCDCGTGEPGTCLACLCEAALRGQWEALTETRINTVELEELMTSIDKKTWLYTCPDLNLPSIAQIRLYEAAWESFRRRITELERELAEVTGEVMDLAPGGANACIDWREAIESIHRARLREAADAARGKPNYLSRCPYSTGRCADSLMIMCTGPISTICPNLLLETALSSQFDAPTRDPNPETPLGEKEVGECARATKKEEK